jgi:formylglycine-generating enzyme
MKTIQSPYFSCCSINTPGFCILLLLLINMGCKSEKPTHAAIDQTVDNHVSCLPASDKKSPLSVKSVEEKTTMTRSHDGMVWIDGGEFVMGSSDGGGSADEYPRHKVVLDGFWMDATEVTNAQFKKFVDATGYITTAERKPDWRS